MQFFEHQDQARGRTALLLTLFSLAVLAFGLLSALFVHFALSVNLPDGQPLSNNHWSLVATAGIGTWGVIALGSIYRMTQLRRGGQSIAETLGGTLINATTQDPFERRAINVVEEMAIAAGLPVPPVYVLDHEKGINAFAAGWSPDDAVIGITRGALEGLKRDQLQGVIAHEFSHILNRDCALNMRMVGVLHGIVVISVIGRIVMRLSSGSRHTSTRRTGGAWQIFVVGAGIWLFGSLGVLIARFIQSAVSHQREFLADASAVQFTRNPEGIAGALATIASQTSSLDSPRGSEASHMLIGHPGGRASFLSALSSHPPLFERIGRILPRWDGNFAALATPRGSVVAALGPSASKDSKDGFIPGLPLSAEAVLTGASAGGLVLEPVESTPGGGRTTGGRTAAASETAAEAQPEAELGQAQTILSSIPLSLRQAAETPFSCRAVLLALILTTDATERVNHGATGGGLQLLDEPPVLLSDVPLRSETSRQMASVATLSRSAHLPLFDIALSTLAGLSPTQSGDFQDQLEHLAPALFERGYGAYCLLIVTLRHLRAQRKSPRQGRLLVKNAIEVVLSVLAYEGHDDDHATQSAFSAGTHRLGKRGQHLALVPYDQTQVKHLDAALATVLKLPSSTRQALLQAAETIAQNDGVLRPSEAQLLRTMAVSLHLAVPPDAKRAE